MTANRAEGVEDFAAEEQAPAAPAFERAGIDLVKRHATARDLGLLESLVAAPGQLVRRQAIDQPVALRLSKLAGPAVEWNAGFGEQPLRKARRQRARDCRKHQAAVCVQNRQPRITIQLRPADAQRR